MMIRPIVVWGCERAKIHYFDILYCATFYCIIVTGDKRSDFCER